MTLHEAKTDIMKQKIYNTLYGAIVADALGVPVEFKSREELRNNPVTDMKGYGTYNLPKGSWSDDSSMTLCLAESIGRLNKIDYNDIMKNFRDWLFYSKFTPDGKMFDRGETCGMAICKSLDVNDPLVCGGNDYFSNGNGSLMRISPIPLYLFIRYGMEALNNEEAIEIIHNVSRLTHGHIISLLGCDIYCAIMIEILKETSKQEILQNAMSKIKELVNKHPDYNEALSKYERISHQNFMELSEEEIQSSGYIVDTLEAAIWCFLNTDNYHDCVLKAVNLGRDTDTVACVAGSIAGLYYGDIPANWIKAIRNKKLVDKIIESFFDSLENQEADECTDEDEN